ncbi:MAG: hypothetical protein UT56_C0015G0014 [Candidatus Levybacteria bacterium GW2011_GWB1_39_7]|nr:MAG: hypothetical protein UT56_C0015G0014 [Candidatus Levybacteria bacterium GW2011_GWB1_39_7]OGH47027.1 MAG: hypothetical protein A3G66_02375 [Candidatus Levybacteria bacterium RIFCSPLOWO2_12_FULL_39_17]
MKLRSIASWFFVFGFLFLVFCFLVTPTANAQFSSTGSRTNYLNTNPDVPQNFHTYTQSVLLEIAAAASCQIAGFDPMNPSGKCLGVDPATGKIGFVENGGGLIGITGQMIAATFDIPVSGSQYVRYLAGNFGIAKKTYAGNTGDPGLSQDQQNSDPTIDDVSGNGVGFSGLSKIMKLWIVFRNVVFMFFVLIFVLIGLGIMFRIKIDPRTVMTIQNQIPKIIIALVLVTFSFAIAGFLIDMMYVLLFLIFNIFSSANLVDVASFSPNSIQGANPLSAMGFLGGTGIAKDASIGIGSIIASLFSLGTSGRIIAGFIGMVIGGLAGSIIPVGGTIVGGVVGGIAGGFLGGGVDKVLGILGGLIAFIVIAAAILIALFRLWFQLLKTYIFILINIVFSPFWIAGGLIPGSTLNFGAWVRDIIANLSAFPTTLLMFLLGKVFIEEFGRGGYGTFVPPFIGNPGNPKNFAAIIGLGIILLTPNVVQIVRAALKTPEGKLSAGIGQSIGAGAGAATGTVRSTVGAGITAFAPTPMPGAKAGPLGIIRKIVGA